MIFKRSVGQLLILVVLLTTTSCAGSPPDSSEPERVTRLRTRIVGDVDMSSDIGVGALVVNAPEETVWDATVTLFEEFGLEVTRLEQANRTIGSSGRRTRRLNGKRLSTYLDCGMSRTAGPNADRYDVAVSLTIQVSVETSRSARVRTTLQGRGRPRTSNGNAVLCSSNGDLEGHIIETLRERVTTCDNSPVARSTERCRPDTP